MRKQILENILSGLLVPKGFKKKGNYWVNNGDRLTKMVHLQKSQFNNSFYINYGFIINSIPLDGLAMHIFKRVSSLNETVKNRINILLNLDNDIPERRDEELFNILMIELVDKVRDINSEDDLQKMIVGFSQAELNMVPLSVKKHFKIIV